MASSRYPGITVGHTGGHIFLPEVTANPRSVLLFQHFRLTGCITSVFYNSNSSQQLLEMTFPALFITFFSPWLCLFLLPSGKGHKKTNIYHLIFVSAILFFISTTFFPLVTQNTLRKTKLSVFISQWERVLHRVQSHPAMQERCEASVWVATAPRPHGLPRLGSVPRAQESISSESSVPATAVPQ